MTYPVCGLKAAVAVFTAIALMPLQALAACRNPVYLTLDTGNMREAQRISAILEKHEVKATFFLANEKTTTGGTSLDDSWQPYWRTLQAQGHAFGNHTFDHVYFRGVDADGRLTVRPQFGAQASQTVKWDEAQLCGEMQRVQARFQQMTGASLDPLWRAPGGKAPPAAMQMAKRCGYAHVHWAAAGFLGDELPSETHPNDKLLAQALKDIRAGDILMAHLGIWSRKDPYAPMLDPLIAGLKARGLCFATLRDHPAYQKK